MAILIPVVLFALVVLMLALRVLVRVRPGEVAEVTMLGRPQPPLGPGWHVVRPLALVRKRPAGPGPTPLVGASGTVLRATGRFVPTGSVRCGARELPAVSNVPIPAGARAVVAWYPVRFVLPELVPADPPAPLPPGAR